MKDKMQELWGKTKEALKRSQHEVRKVSRIGKLKFDLTALERQRERQKIQLAEQLIDLMGAGQVQLPQLESHRQRIIALQGEIDSLAQEIKALAARGESE